MNKKRLLRISETRLSQSKNSYLYKRISFLKYKIDSDDYSLEKDKMMLSELLRRMVIKIKLDHGR